MQAATWRRNLAPPEVQCWQISVRQELATKEIGTLDSKLLLYKIFLHKNPDTEESCSSWIINEQTLHRNLKCPLGNRYFDEGLDPCWKSVVYIMADSKGPAAARMIAKNCKGGYLVSMQSELLFTLQALVQMTLMDDVNSYILQDAQRDFGVIMTRRTLM